MQHTLNAHWVWHAAVSRIYVGQQASSKLLVLWLLLLLLT
jgi:hypothetical protein